MSGRVLQFPLRSISFDQGCLAAEGLLSTPIGERVARARELQLDEPETLLALCARQDEAIRQEVGETGGGHPCRDDEDDPGREYRPAESNHRSSPTCHQRLLPLAQSS